MRRQAPPTDPARPRPAKRRRGGPLCVAVLLLAALPLAGCVEISRTEKGLYGNPLQSYSSGPNMRFDAENYKPPAPARKPWYERMFDW